MEYEQQRAYDRQSNRLGREFANSIRGDPDAERRLTRFCKE